MGNSKSIDIERAARIKKTARIAGVSVRSVQRVLAGDQNNEEVMNVYYDLYEQEQLAYKLAEENHLVAELERLIPLTK